jgi:hypothetical protein
MGKDRAARATLVADRGPGGLGLGHDWLRAPAAIVSRRLRESGRDGRPLYKLRIASERDD